MATTAFTKAPCSPPPKVKKPPACPDCGALECLCRPRFFAGQLLSEQDLNRLDQYIKKKNQLHNRNLHGWGVVNGLKVLCDPCGQIKVSKGYAISPCGDDIVVCDDTPVDICALIRKCKQQDRGSVDCQPFSTPGSVGGRATDSTTGLRGCDDIEEEWVLAIKYAEFPSRGITALRGGGCACGKPSGVCQCAGNGSCGGSCGCGKSGGCDCGGKVADSSSRIKPRTAPSECEPTIVCEGYQFDVFRKAEPENRFGTNDDDDDLEFGGELVEAFQCCVQGLFGAISLPPGQANFENINANPAAWHQWCCRTRDGMIQYFSQNPGTNCELLKALYTLVCPNPNSDGFAQQMSAIADQLGLILIEGLFNCLCLALLPPALEGTSDQRVPLATVKVRGKDCEIVSICNWTVCRKMVTTWPTMCYWWSILPIGQLIRNALDRVCCDSFIFRGRDDATFDPQPDPGTGVPGAVGIGGDDSGFTPSDNFSNSGRINASHRLNPQFDLDRELGAVSKFVKATMARGDKPLDPAAVLNSISRFNLSGEQPNLAKIESRNLPQFLLLNSLARPLAQAGLSKVKTDNSMLTSLFSDLGGLMDGIAVDDGLKDRVAELESKLEQQQVLIKNLQPVVDKEQPGKKETDRKEQGKDTGYKKTGKKTALKKAIKKVIKKTTKKAGKKSGKKISKKSGKKAAKKTAGKKSTGKKSTRKKVSKQ